MLSREDCKVLYLMFLSWFLPKGYMIIEERYVDEVERARNEEF
jgi:hypothetical protein